MGFPGGSVIKSAPANAGDASSIPGLGGSPREGNGNSLQYSYLGNPMDKGVWWATVHGITRVKHDLATKPPPSIFKKQVFSKIRKQCNYTSF